MMKNLKCAKFVEPFFMVDVIPNVARQSICLTISLNITLRKLWKPKLGIFMRSPSTRVKPSKTKLTLKYFSLYEVPY